ncbi:PREDICTED: prostate and testis expressed protein 3 [Condylura cristata]|uniref:prostate and testis expressed protein 3 n=1 Tax=Condylura cristata TaxID=143302 RepID=UPI000334586B|nr:PREDICTED: prostate and testis expressed protein 3 [Condylura cristata]
MEKHFLVIFSFLCLIVAGASLKCTTCHLQTQADRCRRGFGICVAQKDEQCMILKIFQGDTLQLSYMVCQKFCQNLTMVYDKRTYVHECCKENFCNFRL